MQTTAGANPPVSLPALQSAGRQLPSLPFSLTLPDGAALHIEAVLRLVPGKRIVTRAVYQDKTVLAKILFTTSALAREQQGYQQLHDSGATTPEQLACFNGEGGNVVLYHYLANAEPLDQLWARSHPDARQGLLKQLLDIVALCYHAEICQADLHLGNFLMQGETLYALDPASCVPCMDAWARLENLGLLVAQLPFEQHEALSIDICKRFIEVMVDDLLEMAEAQWHRRKQDYLTKMFRDCTDIARCGTRTHRILCRRDLLTPAMSQALADPAALESHAHILKAGRSATVFAVDIDSRRYVFKRYHHKDFWRRVRRLWRTSRAARSWRIAHALRFTGIPTPTPVALIEQRTLGNVTQAWFVTEALSGNTLQEHWQRQMPSLAEHQSLRSLFQLLARAGISHGDMKATNLLVQDKHIFLIDFDGARELSGPALKQALQDDLDRFLRNWETSIFLPALQEVLQP